MCQIHPIALSAQTLLGKSPGAVLEDVLQGSAAGNFGWLTWAGSPNEPTLVESLSVTGNGFTYVNPDDRNDIYVSVGDWVQGKPGVSNSEQIRNALNVLTNIDIIIPVWDQARGNGEKTAYRISAFARIRLLNYRLPQQNRISARFIDMVDCASQNRKPIVDAGADQTITLPNAVSLAGTVSDDGTFSVSWTVASGPGTVTFADSQGMNTTAIFSTDGTYVLHLTAMDGEFTVTDDVIVTVNRENRAPAADPISLTTQEDITISVTLNGADPDGDALVFLVDSVPVYGTLSGTPPDLIYTPKVDYNGQDSFTFKASDGSLESESTQVSILITPVNDAPVADSQSLTTDEDTALAITFSGADVEGSPLSYSIVSPPVHGALSGVAPHLLYTPFSDYHGPDSFSFKVSDGELDSALAQVAIDVVSINDPPDVDAGADIVISEPENVALLEGLVSDDNFSGLNDVTVEWTQFSGPGSVSFGDVTNRTSTVTFAQTGVYILRLTATDGLFIRSDDVAVMYNAAPRVNAGESQTNTLPGVVTLNGNVSDDGLPTGSTLEIEWQKASGPGAVVFADLTAANTTAVFSESGLYVLRLIANDSLVRATNEVAILINRAPLVDAGTDQITTNLQFNLVGTVSDDGLPSEHNLTSTWAKVVGPGSVAFSEAQPETVATFSQTGIYVLRLTASDSLVQTSDDVVITVNSVPAVDAGEDRFINFPEAVVLNATVSDDGLPEPSSFNTYWSQVEGQGVATFSDASATNATVSFSQPGTYRLRLTGNDSFAQASDEMVVSVNEIPTAFDQTVTVAEDSVGTITLAGADLENTPLTFTILSGPANGTLASNQEITTAISTTMEYTPDPDFYGADSFTFKVNDGRADSAVATVVITVNSVNDAPVVDAGADFEMLDTETATLRGIAADDNTPVGATLSFHWEQVSGPGTAVFLYSREAATPIQFDRPGVYVLRLTVSDSDLSASDEVTVTVGRGNRPPVVSVGPVQLLVLPETADLTAYVSDDGLPEGSTLTKRWTQVSGAGTAAFSSLDQTNITVSFSDPGLYVLRLTVDDSHLTNFSQVSIQVLSPEMNQPPTVDAGRDKVVGLTDTAGLCGSIADDPLPRNAVITSQWSVVSGPGTVSFIDATKACTQASFSELGTYVLRLTASDTLKSSSDEISITVYPYNHPPEVDAGPDQTVTIPESAMLDGAESRDGSILLSTSLLAVDQWNNTLGQPGLTGVPVNGSGISVARNGVDVDGGQLYVAGAFTNAGGIFAKSLAKWNGTNWSNFYDPRLLPYAPTTEHGGGTSGYEIGWLIFDCSAGSFCNEIFACVAGRGNEAFAGGSFKDLGNLDGYKDISARWSGTGWESWAFKEMGNHTRVIKTTSNMVYVAGHFAFQPTNATKQIITNLPWSYNVAAWDGTNWHNFGEGIVNTNDTPKSDPDFPGVSTYNAYVTSMAIGRSNELYVAGDFVMQTPYGLANHIAKWNGTDWEPLGTGLTVDPSGMHMTALAVAPNGDVFVGGAFTNAGGLTVGRVARWDGSQWHALGSGPDNGVSSPVEAMAYYGGNLYVGGNFVRAGGISVNRIAKWNGTFWSPVGSGSTNGVGGGSIFAMDVDETGVYVGGTFSSAGGQPANRIAKWEFATPPPQGVKLAGRVSDDGLPTDSVLSALWTKVSGPGDVTFENAALPVTFATFSEIGTYVLRLTADDTDLTALDEVTITVRGNEPPMVTADVSTPVIGISENVTLTGTVTDDNATGPLFWSWSAVVGPGTVTFGNAANVTTTARFSAQGTYLLRLTANDSQFSVYKDVVVTVITQNFPPGLSMETSQTVGWGDVAYLSATVTDNTLPYGPLSFSWSQISGPGQARFADANSTETTASFDALGTYLLRLTANDAELSSFRDITINVVSNRAPVVDAGGSHAIYTFSTVLEGNVTDDGNPLHGSLSTVWRQVSGPGAAILANSNSPVTGVTFDVPGNYRFRLIATDSQLVSSNDAFVNIFQRMAMSAGPDRAITLPETNATLFGWASVYSNEVSSAGLNVNWSKLSGPGTVTFGTNYATNTFPLVVTAGFSMMGTYVLRLQVDGPDVSLQSDTVTVRVAPVGNLPPLVNAGSPQTMQLPNAAVNLNASVSDDGLPNGTLNLRWQQVRGPRPATFSSTNTLNPTVSFTNAGIYTLRFTANDGALTNGSDVVIVVSPADNTPPVVAAGPDFTVTQPERANLVGSFVDDGNPVGVPVISHWQRISGPGHVVFSPIWFTNAQPLATAAFDTPGTYVLRLFSAEFLDGFDDVTVTVLPPSAPLPTNFPPLVDAGPDRFGLTGTDIILTGSASDDGLPVGSSLQTRWVHLSGPISTARTFFANANAAATTARFYLPGTYVLRLVANDSELAWFDDVTVTISSATNTAPSAYAGSDMEVTRPAAANLLGAVFDDGLPGTNFLSATWSKVSGPGNITFVGGTEPTTPRASITFSAAGTYVMRLTASDTQFSASDEVTITVNEGVNQAPVVDAGTDFPANMTDFWPLSTAVTDDGLPGGILKTSWSEASSSGAVQFRTINGTYYANFSSTGQFVLRLTATDTALTNSDEVAVTVYDAPNPPEVALIAPLDSAIITAPTNIIGTARSILLQSYALQHRFVDSSGAADWTTFATNNVAVENAALGTLDPTLLLNGQYELRLTATDTLGRTSVTEPISITVDRKMKVGNFSVAFSDLNIPLSGIPIEVIRSYDSRDKRVGDFGVGWSLGLKNVRLQKNRNLGRNWQQGASGGLYCLDSVRPRTVTVTLGDDEVYKFETALVPQCQFGYPIASATMKFNPIGDTVGTLVPVGETQADLDGFTGTVNLIDLATFDYFNPRLFRFTTAEGDSYIIDEHTGLQSMTDRNGNTLTITTQGVLWTNTLSASGGEGQGEVASRSITFKRDTLGRITNVIDTAGNALAYEYDGNGDLVRFIDRNNQTNSFTYDNQHKLLTIVDARGVQPLRNEYDEAGRLVRQVDSLGYTNEFTHDLSACHEIIRDRLGHVTVHEYDQFGNITRTTDALGNVTSYAYDAHDNQVAMTNALGHVTTYTYDSADNKLTETDPLGFTTRYTYNAYRQPTSITDARGNTTTNIYDATTGDLIEQRDPLGNITRYKYNSRGDLTSQTDALGTITTNRYDSFGNLTNTVTLNVELQTLNSTSFTYDSNGNQLSKTAKRTRHSATGGAPEVEWLTTQYVYDNENRLTLTIFPDGSTNATIYAVGLDKPAIEIDQLGRRTQHEYDAKGNLFRTTYPDNTFELSGYDAENRKISFQDRGGRATFFTNDALARVTTTLLPGSTTTNTFYDAIGRIVATQDERGNPTWFGYDPNCGCSSRQATVTNALGQVAHRKYDENGNETEVTDALGRTIKFVYDKADRRTHIIFPDLTQQITAYDAVGRRIAETDQAGKTTLYGYDAQGRLTSVTNAISGVTRYVYDELGNLVSQTDANNHTTRFEYDRLGRRTKRALPLGQVETYEYTLAGNMVGKTDFNGRTTIYAYDSMNRLLSKTPDASFAANPITLTYTATGQRATMTDPSGISTYSYNERDWLTNKTVFGGTSYTSSLDYSYDAHGNLTGIKSSNANGTDVVYEYDVLNRLGAVDDENVGRTTYVYDDAGNLQHFTYPNAVTTSYAYDSLNRVTNVSGAKLATALANFAYTVGTAGNRLSVAEITGKTISYGYDDLYRVTSEQISGTGGSGSISYTHDAVGNRLTRVSTLSQIPSASYGYDGNDRLLSDTYDANGNTLVGRVSPSAPPVSDTYNFEDRLISRNNGQVQIVYDGDGNKVRETVNGSTTIYIVDDRNLTGYAQVLEELQTSNLEPQTIAVTRIYTYGLDLVSQDQLIEGQWETSFYGYDGHGNTRYLTDLAGGIVATYDYDAFGSLIASSGTVPNAYLYCGEQLDPGTGLYYLRARFMNANSGRFWTRDTFAGRKHNPISLHKYLYASADAVNGIDPSGLETLGGVLNKMHIEGIVNRTVNKLIKDGARRQVQGITCKALKEQVVSGIYIIVLDGALYVGQSGNIGQRIAGWQRQGARFVGALKITTGMSKGAAEKFVREMIEQVGWNLLGGPPAGHNNPISQDNFDERLERHDPVNKVVTKAFKLIPMCKEMKEQ